MPDPLLALLSGRRGHFRMESGYHSDQWFDLDALLADRAPLRPFVAELAHRLAVHRPDAICGPMTGGAQLTAMIAADLCIESFHTERFASPDATGLFPVRYTVPAADRAKLPGRAIAIVDDAISAGSAVRGTLADLLACGARPVALGALFVFGPAADRLAADHYLALEALARPPFSLWPPAECPLCRAGLSLQDMSIVT